MSQTLTLHVSVGNLPDLLLAAETHQRTLVSEADTLLHHFHRWSWQQNQVSGFRFDFPSRQTDSLNPNLTLDR